MSKLAKESTEDKVASASTAGFNGLIEGLCLTLSAGGMDQKCLQEEIVEVFEDSYLMELIKQEESQGVNLTQPHTQGLKPQG